MPIARTAGVLVLLALLAAVSLLENDDRSSAAFTAAARSNPSNALSADASFARGVDSGTYTGDAVDGRQITGLGFRPDIVIIKSTAAQGAAIRTRTMTGDQTKPVSGATAVGANRIEALTANGFQLGTDATVNSNGVSYQWFAATTRSGAIATGSYVGDGTASRDVATPGMAPEAAILLPGNAAVAPILINGMSATARLDTSTTVANSITALDGDGLQVGNSTSSNTNGQTYHWIAFSDAANTVDTGTYTGNNTSGRSITGVGFAPSLVLVRGFPTASRNGVFRASAWTAPNSSYFSATANQTTGITALGADGFTVGNLTHTNANAANYAYLALGDP